MKTVLLIDDARSIRTIFKQVIEEAGYRAVLAKNALEGLQIINDGHEPDLIITDINMPGMNGIQFAKRARAFLKGIPILIMTTESDRALVQEAREVGVTGWMLKPVEHSLFVSKLQKFLG